MRTLKPCGTTAAYRRGCRCAECRSANAEAARALCAQRKAQGRPTPTQVARPRKTQTAGACENCGKPIINGSTCKPCWCLRRATKARAARKRASAAKRLARAAQGSANTWVWVTGECAECLTYFVRHGQASRFCSSACRRKARRSWKIATRDRLAIYARDGWTCQLCMEPVDRDLMATDPLNDWAPSLDHIEPQSWALVPDHSPENLRLAHRWCNSVRGDLSFYNDSDLRAA